MSARSAGARWLASWLRFERGRLGMSRRELLRRSLVDGRSGLTRTVIEDIEGGRRLPTLRRVPALARALGIPGWVVAEHSWLAPQVEGHWQRLRELPPTELARVAAGALPWDPPRAAAAADLWRRAGARRPGSPGRSPAEVPLSGHNAEGGRRVSLLAAAWVRLGHPQLGLWQTEREGADAPWALLARAEAELALARPAVAERLLARIHRWAGQTELDRLRLEALRAEVELHAGRCRRAAALAIELVDRDAGGRWIRARAHRCLAAALTGLSREPEARRWLERLESLEGASGLRSAAPPADAPPAHPR